MLSEREIMIAWLEAMEEIDELEVEFWEILRGLSRLRVLDLNHF